MDLPYFQNKWLILFPSLIVKGNKYEGTCTQYILKNISLHRNSQSVCHFQGTWKSTIIWNIKLRNRSVQVLSRIFQLCKYAIGNESTEICREKWRGTVKKLRFTKNRRVSWIDHEDHDEAERRDTRRWMKIPLTSRRRVTIAPRGRLPSRNLLSPIFSKFHLGSRVSTNPSPRRFFARQALRLEYIQRRTTFMMFILWRSRAESATCGRWPG